MKGRVKNGVFHVTAETLDEAFALGALWEAWREKNIEAKNASVVIDLPDSEAGT